MSHCQSQEKRAFAAVTVSAEVTDTQMERVGETVTELVEVTAHGGRRAELA